MYITQGLKRAAQVNAAGLAVIDGKLRRPWRDVLARVSRLAGGLQALGLAPADRVAILSLNSSRYLECFFASAWAGTAIVPINTRLAVPEIAYCLTDSSAQVLFVDGHFAKLLPELARAGACPKHIVSLDSGAASHAALDYEEIITDSMPVPDRFLGGDNLAGIFYTGGTTGQAKGVMLSHTNLMSNALATIGKLGFEQKDRYLHAAPMFHLADGLSTYAMTMVAATHVFIPAFDPPTVVQVIESERVTCITLVPTMLHMLMSAVDGKAPDLTSLRKLFYGASPMPEALMRRALSALPDCRFFGAYGMTELSPIATILDPRYHVLGGPNAGKLRSVGTATYGVEIAVLDVNREELPRGEIGQIAIRGPNVMLGYWKKPAETQAALIDGWMHSGDLGYMDTEGFIYIADRLKDMIITGGENVYSAEVENTIHQHAGVAQCAVIGIPSEEWGETVHAVVVPKAGASLSKHEIIEHCRQHIAGYKCPRSVEIRSSPLPLSGAGKVLKTELRAPFWANEGATGGT